MLIDTHVHLNADQYDDDLEEVIQRAGEAGIEKMVVVGFDRKTIERTMDLIEKYENVYWVIGWHPVDAIDCTGEDLYLIEAFPVHPKIVVIDETLVDNHRS